MKETEDNRKEEGFIFPLTEEVLLVNDLAVRRDVLEILPLPLGLMIDGEWVWLNRWAKHIARLGGKGWVDLAGHIAQEAAEHTQPYDRNVRLDLGESVGVHFQPLTNLDGKPLGHLAWSGNALAGLSIDHLETAVMLVHNQTIVWANLAACRAFGIHEQQTWAELSGFPAWDDVLNGVTARCQGDFSVRFLALKEYVVVEAWRRELSGQDESMPMEQVASLVHEIRNPLAALSGYVEMAQIEAEAAGAHYYDQMMHEIDRLSRLTSDVMAVSRPLTVTPSWIPLDRLVENAWFAASQGRRAGKRAVRLKKVFDPEQQIWGDDDRIQQVLTNLIKNAVEAMRAKGTQVVVDCREEAKHFVLTVTDNGPGLPSELMGQLFVSRVTTKDSGNGLGLMIVRRIVEAHGGSVRVTVKNGTTFEILIPRPS